MMYVKCKSIKYSTISLNYKKCINFIAINLYCNLTINCSPSDKTIAVNSDWCQIASLEVIVFCGFVCCRLARTCVYAGKEWKLYVGDKTLAC